MDPIEVIEVCRDAALEKACPPVEAFPQKRLFGAGDYQQLWLRDPKRVRRVLDEMMCGASVDRGLELLRWFGVFDALFPEVSAMYGMGDEGGLHKDVWAHTKAVVKGTPPELDVRWGALMHDIGKVQTRKLVNGRVTFHNHDVVGTRIVDSLNDRTKLFQDDVALLRTVRYLVLEHLRPAGYKPEWTDSAVRRLVTECGDRRFFEKLMMLSRADLTTKNPKKRERAMARSAELVRRVEQVIALDRAPRLPKSTMGVLMGQFPDRRPGPWLNQLREELEALMADGTLLPDQPVEYYVDAAKRFIDVGVIILI